MQDTTVDEIVAEEEEEEEESTVKENEEDEEEESDSDEEEKTHGRGKFHTERQNIISLTSSRSSQDRNNIPDTLGK